MINVYVDGDAMIALDVLGSDEVITNQMDIRVEFIDAAPLSGEVVYDGSDVEISMYTRNEIHVYTDVALHGTVKSGEIEIDKGDENTVNVCLGVAEGVNKFLQDKGMVDECKALDEEMQGILFGVDEDGEITAKIVSGKRRPLLLCTTLWGSPRMMRPYMNEIMEKTAFDAMSFEEKEAAANGGDEYAMTELAMAYLNGTDEVEENPEKAYYWFVKSAEAGNPEAMFNAGLFTAKGYGTERDFEISSQWMKKAANEGDEDAKNWLEEFGNITEFISGAEAGDAQAQAELASKLMRLGGVMDQAGADRDYEECLMWAEKAVAQNNGLGCWILALAYEHGRGVEEDINKAIEIFQKGAELGNANCQHNLACEYARGENIEEDEDKSFKLFKASAEQGYGLAMRDLGRCYQFGIGTECDMKAAIEWYEKALEVIDDPELERKVGLFKMLEIGEDNEEENEPDTSNLPDGYMDALDVFVQLDEYEEELENEGVLTDVESYDEEYPRVRFKAEAGDARAIELLARLSELNDNE